MPEVVQTLDDFIEARKSPCLFDITEVASRYESEEPPELSSSSDDEIEESGSRGDFVLLRQSAPNNPEIAGWALKSSLPKAAKPDQMSIDDHPPPHNAATQHLPRIRDLKDRSEHTAENKPVPGPRKSRKVSVELSARTQAKLTLNDDAASTASIESGPAFKEPSLSPPFKRARYSETRILGPTSTSPVKHEEGNSPSSNAETLAPSPLFTQFGVDKSEIPTERALPAFGVASPPRSVGSPSSIHTLPSLTTALGVGPLSPFSAPSPHLSRANSSGFGPALSTANSVASTVSPNFGSGLASYITSRGRAKSTSAPSDQTSASTPTISWSTSQSPSASLPTPSYGVPSPQNHQQLPPISHLTSYVQDSLPAINASMLSPASSTTTAEHLSPPPQHHIPLLSPASNAQIQQQQQQIYTCPQPGCTSAPFATQYLLNSHMNVHSESRPHFCPIKTCPRGPGGQGFKRKNEMIRHGLVHTSPGYTCPFCPGSGPQQHRYPRPDNLQRHVRVHHREVGRDDARLRAVLGQRPADGIISSVDRSHHQGHESLVVNGAGGGGGIGGSPKGRRRRGG